VASGEDPAEGTTNVTQGGDCQWASELRAYAVRLQLHRWHGYHCDVSPTLVRFKRESAAEYAQYVDFFAARPMLAGHVWDAPDGAFEPLERASLSNREILPQCPQAVALAALRTASRLLVQARMDRGIVDKEPEAPGAVPAAEPFPSLVRQACCWKALHDTIREGVKGSGGEADGGWPLALGEQHLHGSFAHAGLDGTRCGVITDPPPLPPTPRPSELLLGVVPTPSISQLVEAVGEWARALPPIIDMVDKRSGDPGGLTPQMAWKRFPSGFRTAIAGAHEKRSKLRSSTPEETAAVVQSIARTMAEAQALGAVGQAVLEATAGGYSGMAEMYTVRAARAPAGGHTCEQLLSGMWYFYSPSASRRKHLAAAWLLGFMPGDVVLDWGSGCGHGLAWIAAEVSILGIAVDLLPVNTAWALQHTPVVAAMASGDYTHAFAALPDASVDHVISNAVVLNLRPDHQCRLLREQVLRVLRPGGTAWFGYLGISWTSASTRTTPSFWRACLRRHSHQVTYGLFDEIMTLGTMEHESYALERNGTGPLASPDCSGSCVSGAFSLLLVKL